MVLYELRREGGVEEGEEEKKEEKNIIIFTASRARQREVSQAGDLRKHRLLFLLYKERKTRRGKWHV
jgi:hypothetical protein